MKCGNQDTLQFEIPTFEKAFGIKISVGELLGFKVAGQITNKFTYRRQLPLRKYELPLHTASMKYGFEQLALGRIVAITYPENLVSQRVLERLGMKYIKRRYSSRWRWLTMSGSFHSTGVRISHILFMLKRRNIRMKLSGADRAELEWQQRQAR